MFGILSIIIIVIGLSLLIIIHEAGHFFAAKFFGILVEEFGFGLPPRIFGKKFGETLISFNWLPFGGFVRIFGESQRSLIDADKHADLRGKVDLTRTFYIQPVWRRAVIISAGVSMNFLLGWWLLSAVFMIGIPQSLIVTEIKSGSIAEIAGIGKGDQIFGFLSVPEFTEFLKDNEGHEITLQTVRFGEAKELKINFSNKLAEDKGKLGVYLIEAGTPRMGFFMALINGFLEAGKISLLILGGVFQLIVGLFTDWSVFGGFAGPVGIVNIAAQTAKLGVANFLQLLSLISLNLAVFNLLPIPALDGGRLLFLLIEKIKGGKVNPRNEAIAQAVSFAILILLILGVTVQDVLRLL